MSWLSVALLAQFVLGTSAVADKLLLKKSYSNPVGYTFWLGMLGLAAIFLLPFGYERVDGEVLMLALSAGAAFIAGMLLYFHALFIGKAGSAIAIAAGFTPLATLGINSLFEKAPLESYQLASFALLVAGGFLLARLEQYEFRRATILFSLLAAICLGASNIISKLVFEETNFATGFFWIKAGSALTAACFLLYLPWRTRILAPVPAQKFRGKANYIINRAYAGTGSVLVFYALSLGIPPLVSATESVKFLVVLAGGWLVLHEKLRLRAFLGELTAFALIGFAVLTLGVGDYLAATKPDPARQITWGVTFSEKFAAEFDKDWRKIYRAVLDDLNVKHVRLIAYWDKIEPEEGVYDWSGLDYQMNLAAERGAVVILAVGQKVPRWPECHSPPWVRELSNSKSQFPSEYEQALLNYIEAVVERYKRYQNLKYWQVENEPFLPFGECGAISRAMLDKEMSLVRSLDPVRPILITDSGEVAPWYLAAKRGDIFGTTMYRRVHNRFFGYIDYHLPPEFFRLKEAMVRALLGDGKKRFIVAELQGEPWLTRPLAGAAPAETAPLFDEQFFRDTIRYANAAGFDEYYLWGVEWWWWQGTKYGNWEYWEIAKELFSESSRF